MLRLLFAGSAASGVEVRQADGSTRSFRAGREVVVCAGAVNSPQLLMLSGIGDEADLRRHGIRPLVHLPGVGRNLQDHLSVIVKARTVPGWSHNPHLLGWRRYRDGARYLLTRGGYLACGATLAAAFVRSDEQASRADLDIGFRPITFSQHASGDVTVDPGDAIALSVFVSRPASRGELQLRSANPLEAPRLIPNYFASESDLRAALRGIGIVRRILKTEPLASCVVEEISPGPQMQSDDDLAAFVRASGKTSFHLAGTCRMGQDDSAVVDPQLRVRGVSNLRVVDASVMPVVTSGNTNAPALMIGEKGADLIAQALH